MDQPPSGRGRDFPIVEAFGYAADSNTPAARQAKEKTWCRFAGTPCEKYRQYGYGYCSVSYAAIDVRRTAGIGSPKRFPGNCADGKLQLELHKASEVGSWLSVSCSYVISAESWPQSR